MTTAVVCLCAAIIPATPARADAVPVTLVFDSSNQAASPDFTDYEGNFYDAGAAPYDVTIGTFDFMIPAGESVVSATISGTFGDVNEYASALADLYVDGGTIKVGECDDFTDPCALNSDPNTLTPWSYNFSSADLANLGTELSNGSIDFTAIQNSDGALIVGDPTLDIEVTPEPASILTFAGGLLALAAFRRRK